MKSLYVMALGTVEEPVMQAIEVNLWQTFGFEIRRLPDSQDPSFAFDAQRGQYSSVAILKHILDNVPADAVKILGVTERDLFIPMLSFVFGQAQVNGKAAVVSLARLQQEFYGIPGNPVLLLSRAIKEATHEIGHTFGLTHCNDLRCPMSLSNNISQVDRKSHELCKHCSIIFNESLTR